MSWSCWLPSVFELSLHRHFIRCQRSLVIGLLDAVQIRVKAITPLTASACPRSRFPIWNIKTLLGKESPHLWLDKGRTSVYFSDPVAIVTNGGRLKRYEM